MSVRRVWSKMCISSGQIFCSNEARFEDGKKVKHTILVEGGGVV